MRTWSAALLMSLLGVLLAGCGDEQVTRDPAAEVEKAARATLAERATIDARVTSPRTEYSVRGLIQLARDRYYVKADFARGGRRAFPMPPLRVIGTGPEAYVGRPDLPGLGARKCWFDPHLPIGSAPGTVSVQEALALSATTTRLLADATERARITGGDEAGGDGVATYEAWVDISSATPTYRNSDELFGSRPKRLAGELDLPLTVEAVDGSLSGLSLNLPHFESAAYLRRFRGVEPVSIEVSLTPTEHRLELRPPNCIAME